MNRGIYPKQPKELLLSYRPPRLLSRRLPSPKVLPSLEYYLSRQRFHHHIIGKKSTWYGLLF